MKPQTAEWVEKAEGDWNAARQLNRVRKDPNYDSVCFHCQQSVEKYLKVLRWERRQLLLVEFFKVGDHLQYPPTRFHHRIPALHESLQLALERLVENGRQQRVEFGGGLGLQSLKNIRLRLQIIKILYNPALLRNGR